MQKLPYVLLLLIVPAMSSASDLMPVPGEQIATSVKVQTSNEAGEEVDVPLLLYAPDQYDPAGAKWPLLLFLHGYGESGDGGEETHRVAIHGPPKQAAAGLARPMLIVSPQCPKPQQLDQIRSAWRPDVLLPLLAKLETELNVDRSRIYLTGLSMGGFGTWRLAAAAPDRFAAVVPICGGGEPDEMAEKLTDVPIWAFHGAKDDLVPLKLSTEMVEAVKQAGGNARITIYPEAGHDSWTATYDNPMFYDWLLGIERKRSD